MGNEIIPKPKRTELTPPGNFILNNFRIASGKKKGNILRINPITKTGKVTNSNRPVNSKGLILYVFFSNTHECRFSFFIFSLYSVQRVSNRSVISCFLFPMISIVLQFSDGQKTGKGFIGEFILVYYCRIGHFGSCFETSIMFFRVQMKSQTNQVVT